MPAEALAFAFAFAEIEAALRFGRFFAFGSGFSGFGRIDLQCRVAQRWGIHPMVSKYPFLQETVEMNFGGYSWLDRQLPFEVAPKSSWFFLFQAGLTGYI